MTILFEVLYGVAAFIVAGIILGPFCLGLAGIAIETDPRKTWKDIIEAMEPQDLLRAVAGWPLWLLWVLAVLGARAVWTAIFIRRTKPIVGHRIEIVVGATEIAGWIDDHKVLDDFAPDRVVDFLHALTMRVDAFGFNPSPQLDPEPELETSIIPDGPLQE